MVFVEPGAKHDLVHIAPVPFQPLAHGFERHLRRPFVGMAEETRGDAAERDAPHPVFPHHFQAAPVRLSQQLEVDSRRLLARPDGVYHVLRRQLVPPGDDGLPGPAASRLAQPLALVHDFVAGGQPDRLGYSLVTALVPAQAEQRLFGGVDDAVHLQRGYVGLHQPHFAQYVHCFVTFFLQCVNRYKMWLKISFVGFLFNTHTLYY